MEVLFTILESFLSRNVKETHNYIKFKLYSEEEYLR